METIPNGKQAAIRAGYSTKTANMIGSELPRKTLVNEAETRQAEVEGSKLLRNPEVQALIAEYEEKQAARLELKSDEVQASKLLRNVKVWAAIDEAERPVERKQGTGRSDHHERNHQYGPAHQGGKMTHGQNHWLFLLLLALGLVVGRAAADWDGIPSDDASWGYLVYLQVLWIGLPLYFFVGLLRRRWRDRKAIEKLAAGNQDKPN